MNFGFRSTRRRTSASNPVYSSTWLRTDTHSPAAIDSAPATSEAKPARRTFGGRCTGTRHRQDEADIGDEPVVDAEYCGAGASLCHRGDSF